jgi:hypothetical protein
MLALLLACQQAEKPLESKADSQSTDSPNESTPTESPPDTSPPQLHGATPENPLPLPDFTASNMDGAARDREDLLGSPTVMWFYPAANTSG